MEVTEKPKLTREYLLANGFKQSAKNPDSFTVESVRLGDISKKLNFPLSALGGRLARHRNPTCGL